MVSLLLLLLGQEPSVDLFHQTPGQLEIQAAEGASGLSETSGVRFLLPFLPALGFPEIELGSSSVGLRCQFDQWLCRLLVGKCDYLLEVLCLTELDHSLGHRHATLLCFRPSAVDLLTETLGVFAIGLFEQLLGLVEAELVEHFADDGRFDHRWPKVTEGCPYSRPILSHIVARVDKQTLRERAWSGIRAAGVSRFPGVEGRIPNFVGAEAAADRLAETVEWKRASTLKCNPDSPQLPVRKRALSEGKTVYMAVPKLADPEPFWRLDPDELTAEPHKAASIKGAARHGRPVSIEDMERIDLIVCGSVALERGGARLGKGGGYSDLEFAIATEAGLVDDDSVIATTIHASQIFDDGTIPVTEHDFPVDLIVTPDEVIRTGTSLIRPSGVLADHLEEEKRKSIPVLGGAG